MTDNKQAGGHLNGAYYGPAIPPPPQAYHRPRRSPISRLLRFLITVLLGGIILAGLTVFIFWIIFRPNTLKFHVTHVSLREFNLTSDNTLRYNLAVNLTVRNPNRRIGVYYDRIEARAYYEGERFDTRTLQTFYQGHKNTSYMTAAFEGRNLVVLDSGDRARFDREMASGLFEIDVRLYIRLRFKVGRIKTRRLRPRVKCELRVPLSSSNGTVSPAPETTKCDLDF